MEGSVLSPFYLGIDLGTTAVKALLADENGHIAVSAGLPLAPCYAGPCRLDMDKLLRTTADLFRQTRRGNAAAWRHIAGVCIAGQGDGLFPLNEAGRPVMHAFTWQDTRAAGQAGVINLSAASAKVGFLNPAFAGSRLALLMWLKEKQPGYYKQTARALTATSFLLHSLTGECAEDASNCAETYDLLAQTRSALLFTRCGMEDALEKYPCVLPADAIAGYITAEAADFFGLPAGIPAATGCLDATACALGAGDTFDAQMILGTTAAFSVYLPVLPQLQKTDAFIDLIPFSPPRWRATLATSAGASAIDYGKQLLYPDADYETLYHIAEQVPPGAEGALFLPFLFGERAPFACNAGNGAFLGLGPWHGREHLLRACIEGVAYSIRHCMEHLPGSPERATVSGGAAESSVLCQILSDVLGMELSRAPKDSGAHGCIRLISKALDRKMTGLGGYGAVFSPGKTHQEAYEKQYRRYRETIDLLWSSQNIKKT
jgi:sugar (pentulose or hexulose) kinase